MAVDSNTPEPVVEAASIEAPAVVAAPVEAAPAPVVEPEVAVVEPVVEVAAEPVAEPAPAEPTADPAPEAAPAEEAKPDADAKPAEPVAPAYEAFKLPEGVEAQAEQIEAFATVLGKYGLTQEAGQELMDLHGAAIKAASDHLAQQQRDVFAETQNNWVKEFDKSAGNRRDTILNDAKWAVTELVKDTKARRELWDVLAFTGAGNHKAVINALATAGRRLREREAPSPGLPSSGARSGTAADRRYAPARR